jgi:hypothetical protein
MAFVAIVLLLSLLQLWIVRRLARRDA